MSAAPFRDISGDEIRAYETDGVVCLRGFFADDWVSALRAAAEASLKNPGPLHVELAEMRGEAGRFFHDTFMWQRNDACRQFVFKSPAARIAADLMKSRKANIVYDQWLIKEPGAETKTPWHHDLTYWPMDGNQICTMWLALDEATAQTGAVEYVKGSHKWGEKYKPASFSGTNQYKEDLPSVPDIDAMRNDLDIVQYELAPGDCTLHHGLLLHGSPANISAAKRRRAYVTRWAGDDIIYRYRDGLMEMPPLPPLNDGDPIDSDLWPRVVG